MATSTSGGAEPLEARRWRPLRELGKVWFNERCATRSKGRLAIRGPFPQAGQGTTRRGGREAPSTIRCIETLTVARVLSANHMVGKHPAPSGALRLYTHALCMAVPQCREAPSTIRCIETAQTMSEERSSTIVGKHPAPSGALRLESLRLVFLALLCREAPSTIRCIETMSSRRSVCLFHRVGKHPAPSGALRPNVPRDPSNPSRSGSTQHHQVH